MYLQHWACRKRWCKQGTHTFKLQSNYLLLYAELWLTSSQPKESWQGPDCNRGKGKVVFSCSRCQLTHGLTALAHSLVVFSEVSLRIVLLYFKTEPQVTDGWKKWRRVREEVLPWTLLPVAVCWAGWLVWESWHTPAPSLPLRKVYS